MEDNHKIDYDPIKSEAEKVRVSNAFKSLLDFIKKLFSIYDVVDKQQTVEDIKNDISFSAINIWILICSIIVASIGLINNSTAVIIGAMLISPLMGPIRGIGYALSSNDFKSLITSFFFEKAFIVFSKYLSIKKKRLEFVIFSGLLT